jgi:hypothetical protein
MTTSDGMVVCLAMNGEMDCKIMMWRRDESGRDESGRDESRPYGFKIDTSSQILL